MFSLIRKYLSFTIFALLGACSSDPAPKIDINKIPPEESIVGPYTYFVPPYSTYYFHHMDKLGFHLDWVRHSKPLYTLQEPKKPFTTNYTYQDLTYTLEEYYQRNAVLGFLILKDNQIISERYFHDSDQNSRFISNSVMKSITSTLFGIALEDGLIASINDPVIKYLPDLSVSGYKQVSLKDVLKMATGIEDSEDFTNQNASIHQFGAMSMTGVPSFTDYIKSLKAKPNVKPGTIYDYESINTQVLGLVIEKVTGMPLNEYMTKKLWSKIGAESDAYLYRAKAQTDQPAFGCFCATLRDYGRFGLMMMNGGILNGIRVVGSSWISEATKPEKYSVQSVPAPNGYGYQWWTLPGNDGAYQATGIFGQLIYINPKKHIVIVETSAWPTPDPNDRWDEMDAVVNAIVAELSR